MTNKTLYKHPTERATIYEHPRSKNLYMSFYYQKKRIQKTTGTSDLAQAKEVLKTTIKNNSFFDEQGIVKNYVSGVKLQDIALSVIEDLEREKRPAGSYKNYIRATNFIIDKIGMAELSHVDRHRLKPLFAEKINRTRAENIRQALKRIFDKAEDERLKFNRPTIPPAIYTEKKQRQAITLDQFKALMDHYASKIFHKENVRKRKNAEVINAKKMYEFIILAYATGARTGELDHVKGADFSLRRTTKGEIQYLLTIKNSKTQKNNEIKRTILIEVMIGRYFYENYTIKKPNDYVFMNEATGKVIKPYDISRNDKRSNPKFYQNHKMNFFVPYCLRHSFITRKILEGVNLMVLAQHCGNSIQMINDFYADFINTVSYTNIYGDQHDLIENEKDMLKQAKATRGGVLKNDYTKIKAEANQVEAELFEHFINNEKMFGAGFLFQTDPDFSKKLNQIGQYKIGKEGLDLEAIDEQMKEYELFLKQEIEHEEEQQRLMEYGEYRTYGDEGLPDFD